MRRPYVAPVVEDLDALIGLASGSHSCGIGTTIQVCRNGR